MNTRRLFISAAVMALSSLLISLAAPAALADRKNDVATREQYEADKAALEAARIAIEAETSESAKQPPSPSIAHNDGKTLLKGGVTYCVPSGTPIKLKISSVPTSGMKMMDRDMDGKLHPAKLGQKISAKTTEDLFVEDNKVIPQGTMFYGHVSKVLPPKRVGRPGSLVLQFDYFKLPDGRQFAFKIEANNTRKSTPKSKLKGLGVIAAHAAGGAAVGAIFAYQIFGLEETIAMHGYNIAGGAAAGALVGTAVALLRHGPEAVLEPGDDLNMEIDSDLLLPAATAPTIKPPNTNIPGLEIKVLKTKMVKDGLDGHQLRVDMIITNNTKKRLKSIDLFVEDDNGGRFAIVGDSEADAAEIIFDVEPLSSKHVMCDFQYEFPKLKRKLVWVDHHSRQPIYQCKLP